MEPLNIYLVSLIHGGGVAHANNFLSVFGNQK
jgi:hypothetical protein